LVNRPLKSTGWLTINSNANDGDDIEAVVDDDCDDDDHDVRGRRRWWW